MLGGVVQINTEIDPERPCLMELRHLSDGNVIRISQSLGLHASGCRLDTLGLEEAAGQVAAALYHHRPDVLIVNKFGKQEVEGRGFRPVIGQAMAMAVPVLTSVAPKNRAGFDAFAEGLATELGENEDRVLAWCLDTIGRQSPL